MRCILHFSSVQGTSAGDLSLKVFEISVISAYILLVFLHLLLLLLLRYYYLSHLIIKQPPFMLFILSEVRL